MSFKIVLTSSSLHSSLLTRILLHSFTLSPLHLFTLHSLLLTQVLLHSFTPSTFTLHSSLFTPYSSLLTRVLLHSYTPLPLHPFSSSLLHSFISSLLHLFTLSLLNPFTLSLLAPLHTSLSNIDEPTIKSILLQYLLISRVTFALFWGCFCFILFILISAFFLSLQSQRKALSMFLHFV